MLVWSMGNINGTVSCVLCTIIMVHEQFYRSVDGRASILLSSLSSDCLCGFGLHVSK